MTLEKILDELAQDWEVKIETECGKRGETSWRMSIGGRGDGKTFVAIRPTLEAAAKALHGGTFDFKE